MRPRRISRGLAGSPAQNKSLNFTRDDGPVYRRSQYRSPQEIADSYGSRMLTLLAELRQVGHRREAYENGGPNK